MSTADHQPRNRREADALARLLQLLADGVAFDSAVWTASECGLDLDTARLVDLHDGHRRCTAAAAVPMTAPDTSTTHTPGPWFFHTEAGFIVSTSGIVGNVDFHGATSMDQETANGRLMAAAPELLRCAVMALEELQEAERVNPLALPVIRALRATIAAAGGTTTTRG